MGESELQFETKSKALEYITKNNWLYIGRKGLFRQHDRYEGLSFYSVYGDIDRTEYETRWCLKLYADGYLKVKALKDTSGGLPTGGFGMMWHSREQRDFEKKLADRVNQTLEEEKSELRVKFMQHPFEFPLFCDDQKEPIAILRSPLFAIDYSEHRKEPSIRAKAIWDDLFYKV